MHVNSASYSLSVLQRMRRFRFSRGVGNGGCVAPLVRIMAAMAGRLARNLKKMVVVRVMAAMAGEKVGWRDFF